MSDQTTGTEHKHKLSQALAKFTTRVRDAGVTTDDEMLAWFEVPDQEDMEDVVNTLIESLVLTMKDKPQASFFGTLGSFVVASILFGAVAAREKLL